MKKENVKTFFLFPPNFPKCINTPLPRHSQKKTSVSVFKSPNYAVGHTKDHKMC